MGMGEAHPNDKKEQSAEKGALFFVKILLSFLFFAKCCGPFRAVCLFVRFGSAAGTRLKSVRPY